MAAISEEQPTNTDEPAQARGPGRPFRPGQSGNLSGRPRRHLALEAQIRELHGPLALDVLERLRVLAVAGHVPAAKSYLDRVLGPAKSFDPMAIAEHLRRVERDRVNIILSVLGDRVRSMDAVQLSAFLQRCSAEERAFLQAAEDYMAGNPAAAKQAQDVAELGTAADAPS